MKNITVSIDEETHRLARVRAAELGTSISALIRGYLKTRARERADKTAASRRLGFMAGQTEVPDDFDSMGGPRGKRMTLLLWAAGNPGRLSSESQDLLGDPATELMFSTASIWEIVIKNALGRSDCCGTV